MLRAGWEVNQVFGTVLDTNNNNLEVKYLNIELAPYAEGQVYIESLFNIARLYENEFIVDLAKFKYAYWYNIIINGKMEMCTGNGVDSDRIELVL